MTIIWYIEQHTVWRAVIISENTFVDVGNTYFSGIELDNDSEEIACVYDLSEHGYDCYDQTINNNNFPHIKTWIWVSEAPIKTPMIILLEEANDLSS